MDIRRIVPGTLTGSLPIFAEILLISDSAAAASSFRGGPLAQIDPPVAITSGYGVLALAATSIVIPFARHPADTATGVHHDKESLDEVHQAR